MREISSVQNPVVKHLVKLRTDTAYRHAQNSILVEGEVLIQEICENEPALKLITDSKDLSLNAKESFYVTPTIMKKISGVESSTHVIAEVKMPAASSLKGLKYLIALDGVSDPGNMGTLFRTALALGWEGVFIIEGSCDPFNDKVVRSSKGALFRLPYRKGKWNELQALIKENQLLPLAADMTGTPLSKVKPKQSLLLVLGNEAKGLSHEAESFCQKISIPMPGNMESLNVAIAGGILMYSLKTN